MFWLVRQPAKCFALNRASVNKGRWSYQFAPLRRKRIYLLQQNEFICELAN